MEQMLLSLDLSAANDEELNGIFRCAHSIKGGAATFGFSDVTELTHRMESLLDRLRRHEITPVPAMVDVLLESADASRSLLARHQAGGEGEPMSTAELVMRIETLAQGLTEIPQLGSVATEQPAVEPVAVIAEPQVSHVPQAVPAISDAVIGTEPPAGARTQQINIGPLSKLEMGMPSRSCSAIFQAWAPYRTSPARPMAIVCSWSEPHRPTMNCAICLSSMSPRNKYRSAMRSSLRP